jgi:5-methylthioribose kinase
VYHFDEVLGAMVMQYIEEPHIILRKGLIASQKYSTLASDMATFAANTLFYTSGLHLPAAQIRQQVAKWSMNHNMCALTEQVSIYTYTYIHTTLLTCIHYGIMYTYLTIRCSICDGYDT